LQNGSSVYTKATAGSFFSLRGLPGGKGRATVSICNTGHLSHRLGDLINAKVFVSKKVIKWAIAAYDQIGLKINTRMARYLLVI